MNPIDMLQQSKCFNCKYRLSRILEPLTQEDKEYYMDVLYIDDPDEYDLYIEQHKCLMTNEDIDSIIRECNKFSPKIQNQLLREYKF